MIPTLLPTYARAPLSFVKGEGSWLFEADGGFVMSGRESKINAVIPETGTVITVIRYPQAKPAKEYRFKEDKRAMVLFGKRLR